MCIITKPLGKSGLIPLINTCDILSSIYSNIFLLTSNEGKRLFIKNRKILGIVYISAYSNIFSQIWDFIQIQISYIRVIRRKCGEYDKFVFISDSHIYFLIMTYLKLKKKKSIIILGSSIKNSNSAQKTYLNHFLMLVEYYTLFLSTRIIAYYNYNILIHFRNKTHIAYRHLIDQDVFNNYIPFENRKNNIAFVGRFSVEKGCIQFCQSVNLMKNIAHDATFYMVGEGSLEPIIKKYIKEHDLSKTISIKKCMKR